MGVAVLTGPRVLVVNAGSSSLKLRLLDGDDTVLASRDVTARDGSFSSSDVADALAALPVHPDVVGHRVVHGGPDFRGPVLLTRDVDATLHGFVDLAPLHQPKSLAAIDAVRAALPALPEVACFDTAFHATLPPAAAAYAVPAEWRRRWGLRKYGFHGLSHAYAARRARELVPTARSVVTCHLGAGASLCAVLDGRSVDTTMGFTPLDGLVMATRSGSLDPGLLLWLQEHEGVTARELAYVLEHRSGLLGLGGTADMREVITRREAGDPDAVLAFAVYVNRLVAGVAAMTAALGGIDVLLFTGGVGENAAPVRAAAAGRLGYLGVAVDEPRNTAAQPDADVSASAATVRTLVVAAREDLQIALESRQVLAGLDAQRTEHKENPQAD